MKLSATPLRRGRHFPGLTGSGTNASGQEGSGGFKDEEKTIRR